MHLPHPCPPRTRTARFVALTLALGLWMVAAACEPKPDSGAPAAAAGWVILDPQDPARDYDVDLGHMAYGDSREHVVRMKNAEGRPIVISEITQGCSCTQTRAAYVAASGARVEGPLRWAERSFEVPADAVLELRLLVDSKLVPGRNTVKRVLVRIQSDSSVDPFKTLELHTIVDFPFYVVPPTINLGQVPIGGIAAGSTEISQALGTGELVLGVLSTPEGMDAALETPEELGSPRWRLSVRWFPPLPRGSAQRTIVLKTSGPGGVGEGRPLDVDVLGVGVDNVIAEPMAIALPERLELNAGAGAVMLRSLVGGNRLFVTGARTEGPLSEAFRAVATPIAPDDKGRSETWMVQLTCVRALDVQGAFAGAVVVTLDDPTTPSVRIPYTRKALP